MVRRWELARKHMVPSVRPKNRLRNFGADTDSSHTAIPGPYPVTLQPGQESANVYYVVSHDHEVGIFTDEYVVSTFNLIALTRITSILSTHAIAGISNGHQVAVGTWYEAAILYNRLWNEALIIRVRD